MNKMREDRWNQIEPEIEPVVTSRFENVTKRDNYFAELDEANEKESKYLSAFFWLVCVGIPVGLILAKCGVV